MGRRWTRRLLRAAGRAVPGGGRSGGGQLGGGRSGSGHLGGGRRTGRPLAGSLQARADELGGRMFLGGPVDHFEEHGRLQLIALIRRGLAPEDHLLDVGCGALRAGYWLIHFLDSGRYLGLEPNRAMLDAARQVILEPGLEEAKQPRFDHNENFDLSVFGVQPRFVLARSIWTHASKEQIEQMLASYAAVAPAEGLLLASYLPAGRFGRRDHRGETWVGRGPQGDVPGLVAHRLDWIAAACRRFGLSVRESGQDNFGQQVWLEVRPESGVPAGRT